MGLLKKISTENLKHEHNGQQMGRHLRQALLVLFRVRDRLQHRSNSWIVRSKIDPGQKVKRLKHMRIDVEY